MDTGTAAENIWLTKTFGAGVSEQRTGMPAHMINTLLKLLWPQRQKPAI